MRQAYDITPSLKTPIIYPTRLKRVAKSMSLEHVKELFDAVEAHEIRTITRAEDGQLEFDFSHNT